jgi:nucleoid DNA-binding protein
MTFEQEIIKDIAKKYNLTMQQVEDIVYSQHRFVAHVMKDVAIRDEIYFPSVRLMDFGIFYCPEKIKYVLTKNKNESI